jgi:DNA polymerase epsilon subunit 1
MHRTTQRKMVWTWRGTYIPAQRGEHETVRRQLESERFPKKLYADNDDDAADGNSTSNSSSNAEVPYASYHELPQRQQSELLLKRLKDYSRRVYKRATKEQSEERQATVCMRENSFYIDTVRAFRDRRYTYKAEHKTWQRNLAKATSPEAITQAQYVACHIH